MRVVGIAPLGGEGGIVEIDETFIGRKEGAPKKRARRVRTRTPS